MWREREREDNGCYSSYILLGHKEDEAPKEDEESSLQEDYQDNQVRMEHAEVPKLTAIGMYESVEGRGERRQGRRRDH